MYEWTLDLLTMQSYNERMTELKIISITDHMHEWVATISNVVIVTIALFGSKLVRWWNRPVFNLILSNRNCYEDPAQESEQEFCAAAPERPKTYYVDMKNKGRGRATDVTVECVAILKKAGDGDTFSVREEGHLGHFIWQTDCESKDILGNSTELLKFIRFDKGEQYADNSGAKEGSRRMGASLCVQSICNYKGTGRKLSKEGVCTFLIKILVRASNTSKAVDFWLSVHWDPSEAKEKVSSETFKVRPVTKSEKKIAVDALNEFIAERDRK